MTKIESGRFESVSLLELRRVVSALDGTVELILRVPGGDADRTLNAGHAAMHEAAARLLRRTVGWAAAPEVTFSIYGERGVIDVLAWHAASRTLLVVELKTLLVDINDLMATMDRRRRLAGRIARDRGWAALHVATWVAIADTPTNHRRLASHSTVLRTAFPADGRRLRAWLRRPVGAISALSFLSMATPGGARLEFRPIRQVRTLPTAPSTHESPSVAQSAVPQLGHRP